MKYFDRDISWLSFNERVLQEANDRLVPLYERIKFLAIYSSNLDEFFRVRVALLEKLVAIDEKKLNKKIKVSSPSSLLEEILKKVDAQQQLLGKIICDSILPELLENKVHLYFKDSYREEHIQSASEMFYDRILAFIKPVIIEKEGADELFLKNRKLYVVVELEKDNKEFIGVVNIPSDKVARFYTLPAIDGVFYYTFIDDIIKHFANVIFQDYTVTNQSSVKINRDAELFLDKYYSDNVMTAISKSLKSREIGDASRFIYEPNLSSESLKLLKQKLNLTKNDCVSGGRYHNLFDFFTLPNPIGKSLENEKLPSIAHPALNDTGAIFNSIDKKDILLAFPYQKYEYVLRFFNQAAIDKAVKEIKLTIYRVAEDSRIAEALISAAKNGKKVTILIEAKARFDESNNLKWAKRMQKAGIEVIFSKQNIKVHAKVALVKRESNKGKLVSYAFLGTGNFNEKTASIYTDYALLTSDKKLTKELDQTLDFIFSKTKKISLKHLLVAQVNMLEEFIELIDFEIAAAKKGEEASILLKLNNLEDIQMIDKLYEAADSGVKIRILIRGICTLITRKNITLVRLVDRYLEHSRIYIFHNNGDTKIFAGSADWMGRNLRRRIEVVFPIYSEAIKTNILTNLELQMKDNVKAVRIDERSNNIPMPKEGSKDVRAQLEYYNYLKQSIQ